MTRRHSILKRIFGVVMITVISYTAPIANATQIDFTGGIVTFNDGSTPETTDGASTYQNVLSYEEGGFILEFVFASAPTPFSTIAGDYYDTGNDVIHLHWAENGNQVAVFGQVQEIIIRRVDNAAFDLGGFRVSTNTANGGDVPDGNELTWINTSAGLEIFTLLSDCWGLGCGPDPLITIAADNVLFNDITWFSFTNDALSTAVGLGLDNFFLDEPGDPDGSDPTPGATEVPEPGTLALLGIGLAGIGLARRRRKV